MDLIIHFYNRWLHSLQDYVRPDRRRGLVSVDFGAGQRLQRSSHLLRHGDSRSSTAHQFCQ